jgi:thioredoxin-like negative regulator of GroEL
MQRISHSNFATVVNSKKAAVVHFDAAWNTYRAQVRQAMLDAERDLGGYVAFAEADCDAEPELAASIPVQNVPFLAYFRDGMYVGGRVGAFPDIRREVEHVLRGERVK